MNLFASIGSMVNQTLDRFLPDVVGDVVGGTVDFFTGNPVGAGINFADAAEDVLEEVGLDEVADVVDFGLDLASTAGYASGGQGDDMGLRDTPAMRRAYERSA